MKFNWGTGITIFIILFVTFILSFVFTAAYTHTDLYAEDYYQQELDYQSTIVAKSNAQSASKELFLSQATNSIVVHFPANMNEDVNSGTIQFYRPNNASDDVTYDIKKVNDKMIISKDKLTPGKYNVKIYWKEEGEDFLVATEIVIE
jgi:nitrogen fixation protein FixH